MELKISNKSKRKLYTGIYISGVIFIGLFIIFSFMFSTVKDPVHPSGAWIVFGILFFYFLIIDIGPGIYLYREYIHYTENKSVLIDTENSTLTCKRPNETITTASFSIIKEIIVYIPPNNYRNTITFTSMEDFSYARFELKDGREFYITCLMIPNLKLKDFIQNTFPEVPIDFHRWWIFPSIRLVNYCRKKKKQETSNKRQEV